MNNNIPLAYTPIEKHGGVWLKRDDLYCRAGIGGGKVRAAYHLATHGSAPCQGLITATARSSTQAQIVARLARHMGVPARCHMPQGDQTSEMADIMAQGGELVQHRAGYNNVIQARAQEDAKARPTWRYIPFGLAHPNAINCTRAQVRNIPHGCKRVVICIGGGISTCGVLWGLQDAGLAHLPVIGIRVGADPVKRLNTFAPFGWRNRLRIEDVTSTTPYSRAVAGSIGGVELDPHYEAKCLPFVRDGDLFWIVGIRV